ncbi:MAG TPA: hypothetical protein VI749_02745 [Candidatus Omnitrophota bacterium]|nr:hypothetical protein [Candidatus Omnitrophota bacterium]
MNNKLLKSCVPGFAFVAIHLVLAQSAGALDRRSAAVTKELDCVAEAFQDGAELTWADVCSTNPRKAQQDAVTQELDAYEIEYEYGRQNQYESSVEYLQHFMKTAQDRPVAYEDNGGAPYAQPIRRNERISSPALDRKYTQEQYRDSGKFIKANIDIRSGYRFDNLDWSIAGNLQGANPNVFAEYFFEDIEAAQIKAKANIILANRLVFDGYAAYAEILDGDSEVSEYDGNNRTDLAIRDESDTNEDKLLDFSGALGWRFKIDENDVLSEFFSLNQLYLTFLLGYSRHEQQLSLTDGVTVIDNTATPDLGAYDGLDSSYDAEWKGPWAGLELFGRKDRIMGLFRVEYHLADYYGWGQLNLQPSFQQPKSFEHTTEGNGWIFNLDLGYQLTENFSLDFAGDLQLWNAKEGVDRLFLIDGSVDERQLNEVNWESYALMLGATLRFH